MCNIHFAVSKFGSNKTYFQGESIPFLYPENKNKKKKIAEISLI